MIELRPMRDAPKVRDGKSYRFRLPEVVVSAYWSNDLQDWIADCPQTIDRIPAGAMWEKPVPSVSEENAYITLPEEDFDVREGGKP